MTLLNGVTGVVPRLGVQGDLLLPLVLSLWIAWKDVRTHRIPNYLTLGGALAGLGFQMGARGWPGLADGLGGLGLGFLLLLVPYMWGGMGAGDVKALAALGAWLGLRRTVYLFVFMGISGGVLMLAVLWWRGLLWAHIRRLGVFLWNRLLSQSSGSLLPAASSKDEGIPYGLAMALGMALLCWRRF